MDLCLTTTRPAAGLLEEAAGVYAAAFGQAPYHEDPQQAAAFTERVVRYADEREGFRFVTARGDDGRVTGLALAVLARPGTWWRDQAAAALAGPDAERWLGARCLEVVHVAVTPASQGQGTGKLIHDTLIGGTPAPTGVLSCHPAAEPAQRLYLSRSWTLLTETFRIGDSMGYWLMARDL